MLARRGLLAGLGLLAAPAIIRTPGLLMPVRMPALSMDNLLVSATERYADGSPYIVWVPSDGKSITFQLSIKWDGTWQPYVNQGEPQHG